MNNQPRVFHGIGASPGVAIGRIFLLDRRQVRAPRYHIQPDQVDYEISRLDRAVAKSVEQLESIRSRFIGGGVDHHAILEAHEMMLKDRAMFEEATGLIRNELINAEWAVSRVLARLRSLFERVTDAYFRERRDDIDFVGERLLRNLAGQTVDITDVGHFDDGTIVVAHDLSPVDTALLSRNRITAFVTEVGGKTSHTSIIARALEVPAVVGVHGILEATGSGDLLLVDGVEGIVVLKPSRTQLEEGRERSEQYRVKNLDLLEAKSLAANTTDGHQIHVAGNIELPSEVATLLARGGEAVGLYRTEFLFLGRTDPPGEEDHYRTYALIFDEMGDRQVTIRTLDLGGEKIFNPRGHEPEPNPALGLRAIRYCFEHPDLFEAQIAGLLRASTRGNLRILLPMISGVGELRMAKEIIQGVEKRLEKEGKEFKRNVPLGVMIEVPSAVLLCEHIAKECDFFAIGTNDLMQYLLAVDRTNERVDYLYHPLNPALLRMLDMITKVTKQTGIEVSVCGEMAGDANLAPVLLGLGFKHLSCSPASIPKVKRVIREQSLKDCEALVQKALLCATHQDVDDLVNDFFHQQGK
ncbi:MAG: phosphoenolpyruvate--protein phosphotransferase [Deltaproteobacteria bacterium]|nr:phosphoenolpyruvate--protein phosphotransferase [Deltaproteobacteria bacterium]